MTKLHDALSAILSHLRKLGELDIARQDYAGLVADLQLEFFVVISELNKVLQQNDALQKKAIGLMEDLD